MTVRQLINELIKLDQALPVKVYEPEGNMWDDLYLVDFTANSAGNDNEVRLIGRYAYELEKGF